MFTPRKLAFICGTVVPAATVFAQWDRPYTFRSVAASASSAQQDFGAPVINKNGSILFTAWKSGVGNAILTGPDFDNDAVVTNFGGSPFASFGSAPVINDAGTIAFDAVPTDSSQGGVYVVGDPTMINITTGSTGIIAVTGIDNAGRITASQRFTGQSRILSGQAGIAGAQVLAEQSPDDTGRFRLVQSHGAATNNVGTVAFVGRTWDWSATYGYLTGIFEGGPQNNALLDASDNLFRGINAQIDLNNAGTLAFSAHRFITDENGDPVLVFGLYRGTGTNLTQIASAGDDIESFTAIDINDAGRLAFLRKIGLSKAIFDGGDLVHDRVIGPGDQLFGKTVASVSMRRGALNDQNDIAFQYSTMDEASGIAIASLAMLGDADANAIIDFDDYARIDNGFNQGLTGWENGDFDGNGVINFDDYALIDNSFNQQNGGTGISAVPEPASVIAASGLAALAAIGRIRRRGER